MMYDLVYVCFLSMLMIILFFILIHIHGYIYIYFININTMYKQNPIPNSLTMITIVKK